MPCQRWGSALGGSLSGAGVWEQLNVVPAGEAAEEHGVTRVHQAGPARVLARLVTCSTGQNFSCKFRKRKYKTK